MNASLGLDPAIRQVEERTLAIFAEQAEAGHRKVDRMLALLLALEWLGSIAVALVVSPTAWAGEIQGTHPHVWAAVGLGGLIASVPVALALTRPGRASTRHCVAIGQMLLVALLIHLSGGRPEAHFHVFGSLAFLALYRDWRVMITASLVIAVDHFLRGIYWPMSAFGLLDAPWRWAEHSLWVVFEDAFLIFGMGQALALKWDSSRQRAEVEATRDRVEAAVLERTAELGRANADLRLEIAERRKAEAEAHRSLEVADHANRAKGQFLANMSHEIRTPMNAIIGMTEVTLGQDLSAEQRDNLEVVRVAADSLLALIDDILDFSKIEAGRLDLEPIRFRPREAVESASKTLDLQAREKGLTLSTIMAPDVPEALVGDPNRLRQVLINLIGNAIKFTSKGRVEVRVGLERDEPDGVVLKFSVVDDGIGIPQARQEMIFDRFSQADGSTTRRFGGTGLGLSISTGLVELMGGRLWVESEVGRGSQFQFTACFGKTADLRPEKPVAPRPSRPTGSGRLRVLLVDDNDLNRRVGQHLVGRLGHDVRLAEDGFDAVDRYERERPFDLVLMDVEMPEMDGIGATALIRKIQERQGRRCPIIALTAYAMKSDRDRCLAGGMDEHLAKPIRVGDLERLIDRFCPTEGAISDQPEPRWALDPDEVRATLPFGDEEMAEVVGLFRETCREQLASLRHAIEDGEPDELARSAHGLMGCLGLFATEATIALAAGLEEAGRSGELDGTDVTFARLENAIEAMRPTLDRLAEMTNAEPDRRPSREALVF
jgi:two-component system sensor histidine kinase/response regulator